MFGKWPRFDHQHSFPRPHPELFKKKTIFDSKQSFVRWFFGTTRRCLFIASLDIYGSVHVCCLACHKYCRGEHENAFCVDHQHLKTCFCVVSFHSPHGEPKIDTYQILKIFTRSHRSVNPFENKVLIVITLCFLKCAITHATQSLPSLQYSPALRHLFPYELFNLITLENHFQIHSNFGGG